MMSRFQKIKSLNIMLTKFIKRINNFPKNLKKMLHEIVEFINFSPVLVKFSILQKNNLKLIGLFISWCQCFKEVLNLKTNFLMFKFYRAICLLFKIFQAGSCVHDIPTQLQCMGIVYPHLRPGLVQESQDIVGRITSNIVTKQLPITGDEVLAFTDKLPNVDPRLVSDLVDCYRKSNLPIKEELIEHSEMIFKVPHIKKVWLDVTSAYFDFSRWDSHFSWVFDKLYYDLASHANCPETQLAISVAFIAFSVGTIKTATLVNALPFFLNPATLQAFAYTMGKTLAIPGLLPFLPATILPAVPVVGALVPVPSVSGGVPDKIFSLSGRELMALVGVSFGVGLLLHFAVKGGIHIEGTVVVNGMAQPVINVGSDVITGSLKVAKDIGFEGLKEVAPKVIKEAMAQGARDAVVAFNPVTFFKNVLIKITTKS